MAELIMEHMVNMKGTLGSKEKNITLAISMKLVAELKKQMPEVNIIPTRTTDVFQFSKRKSTNLPMIIMAIFLCVFMQMRSI